MGYAGVIYNNPNEIHMLEQRISMWFFKHSLPFGRSPDQKYWSATNDYPFNDKNEMFFAIFRYFEEAEKSDCLINIASAFQMTEIYLHYTKLPSMIRHVFRLANRKLKQHLIKEFPMSGRFVSLALTEREPLIRNF